MKRILFFCLGLALLGGGLATVLASRPPQEASLTNASASLGVTSSAIELLEAYPFVVDEPFVHEWRAEKPVVNAGYLLVLRVDPEVARPRDTYEPVLYVGTQTAERCAGNDAPQEGERLVVLVPAPLDATGKVDLDLDTVPIWFGGHELPERVDAARITRELAAARAVGLGPVKHAASLKLRTAAVDAIHARTRWQLQTYVEDLIHE